MGNVDNSDNNDFSNLSYEPQFKDTSQPDQRNDHENKRQKKRMALELEQPPALKWRPNMRRAWTSTEQESLYIAVEKYKLYGQWYQAKTLMNLDRTAEEIEQEYIRLYAEIPDSNEEYEEKSEELERAREDKEEGQNWELQQRQDNYSYIYELNASRLRTPSVTATSGESSMRSSKDNMAMLSDCTKDAMSNHSKATVSGVITTSTSQPLLCVENDEDNIEDEDDDMGQNHDKQPHRQQYGPHNHIPVGTAQPPAQLNQQNQQRYQLHQRMARIWTPERSEYLKNLVEFYFPGSYRINWVWVAAQMGNVFTRKQCKNKWEIMRRRMGTEEEINLLKRGYQEFGPSWGQIQEKYLPERSSAGISTMWSLLETREAEQRQLKQQQPEQRQSNTEVPPTTGLTRNSRHGRHHSTSSLRTPQYPDASPFETPFETPFDERGALRSMSEIEKQQQQLNEGLQRKRAMTLDIEAMDLNFDRNRQSTIINEHSLLAAQPLPTMSQEHTISRHVRYASEASALIPSSPFPSSTPLYSPRIWMDRNHPMAWTEPLTRRLEELVHQHFPNHQKINWVKISSMMGSNPTISRDQCKRRWYLISQNNSSLSSGSNISNNYSNDSRDDDNSGLSNNSPLDYHREATCLSSSVYGGSNYSKSVPPPSGATSGVRHIIRARKSWRAVPHTIQSRPVEDLADQQAEDAEDEEKLYDRIYSSIGECALLALLEQEREWENKEKEERRQDNKLELPRVEGTLVPSATAGLYYQAAAELATPTPPPVYLELKPLSQKRSLSGYNSAVAFQRSYLDVKKQQEVSAALWEALTAIENKGIDRTMIAAGCNSNKLDGTLN
ncbi:hypothetical protein BX616_005697 [Lobosporangium transversale]|uniref:Myb-like domain-containing protein n=1 Tax=Lobosporangium transversale TaxID=64571 RepID=A0A1Y2H0S2_9FUNG|nr:hypothetical protein BCR41DRAFT_391592 [Lobosporangium transversale]KAF9915634.1 hypothetical protein BX616_005697 [Lobosporangium transversale]ORZ28125.1 hypothetical protein BCR41DRAFT_391592 [Lobosporangium transversale]|eukprot:XP_021885810.1 hypothetical protein BCR41DRAFT_391592 [Lobosporangium transversale]